MLAQSQAAHSEEISVYTGNSSMNFLLDIKLR